MPVTAANIRFQDYQFSQQLATGTWRWTTRMDVSGSVPTFEVRDVITPYGTLRDNTPIPGDVIMHERPQGRGYVRLRETGHAPWPAPHPDGDPRHGRVPLLRV